MSSEGENWVLGVTLGLLGSIAINTGNNIQSLGLKKARAKDKVAPVEPADQGSPDPQPKKQNATWLSPKGAKTAPYENDDEISVVTVAKQSPLLSMTWVIGTIIFVTGSLLNFASYAFAAQSMLASLESVQFVTNLLFGKFMLGAHVTQTMMAGTFLTVAGTVMAVQFSSKETLDLDTEDIKKLYGNPAYQIYLVIMALMLVALHLAYRKLEEKNKIERTIKKSDVIMPCIYSVWSALVGTQSVVQAKVLAELLAVHSNGKENIFKSWFTYTTIVLWIMTVLVWLKRLNDALEIFNPLFIIPLLQVSFIFFAIVSGGIFFREFNQFDANQWVGFWFGIIVMFGGLVLLTPQPISTEDDQLHRDLVNLILEQRGSGAAQNSSEECTLSPGAEDIDVTPRTRTSSIDDTKSKDKFQFEPNTSTTENEKSPFRSPRFSKESMNMAKVAHEVTNDISLLLQGAPTTRVLSHAMVEVTDAADARKRRRQSLEMLLEKIRDSPISSNGWKSDIVKSLHDLNLTDFVSVSPPGPDKDIKTHLAMTQEKLRSVVELEIQQSITPREISYNEIT